MGFFSDPPKRITKKELEGTSFTPGALSGLRSGEHKLNDHQFHELKTMLSGYSDSDLSGGQEWQGITGKELDDALSNIRANKNFTPKQIEEIEKHLRKAL